MTLRVSDHEPQNVLQGVRLESSPVLSQGHLQKISGAGLAQHPGFGDSLAISFNLTSGAPAKMGVVFTCSDTTTQPDPIPLKYILI